MKAIKAGQGVFRGVTARPWQFDNSTGFDQPDFSFNISVVDVKGSWGNPYTEIDD
jgi:hypothetical protein